jgi:hypothetical protein
VKIDTKLWTLNQASDPVRLLRIDGSEAFLLRDNGELGHQVGSKIKWYLNNRLSSTQALLEVRLVLVPRLTLFGGQFTTNVWVGWQARKLIQFAQEMKGSSIAGTLHLIDLWSEIQDEMPRRDLALLFSSSKFDTSALTPIPEYCGWTGIFNSDEEAESPPRKNRYSRPWVI